MYSTKRLLFILPQIFLLKYYPILDSESGDRLAFLLFYLKFLCRLFVINNAYFTQTLVLREKDQKLVEGSANSRISGRVLPLDSPHFWG